MLRASLITVALSLVLSGCGGSDTEPAVAQPITDADSCHVCGMLILDLPGPKGQAYLERDPAVRKFCSTTDLFAFLLQPENEGRLRQAYVLDMGITPWTTPGDDAFISAEEAWYVIGHSQRGAMGHTLASFGEHRHAEAFSDTYGGEILGYQDIDLALLGQLGHGEAEGFNHTAGHLAH